MTDDDLTLGLRVPGREYTLAELRTEDTATWMVRHFCPLCGCTKSGYEAEPNNGSDWCEDSRCRCHDEDLP